MNRQTAFISVLAAAILVAPAALAQQATLTDTTSDGATFDGAVDDAEYATGAVTGINSSTGVLGDGAYFAVESDSSGEIVIGLRSPGGMLNERVVVIYLDTEPGDGIIATDNQDVELSELGRAVSGSDGIDASVLTFAPGFTANYALAFGDHEAGVYALDWMVPPTRVADLGVLPNDIFVTSNEVELSFSLTDLGLTPGGSFDLVATLIEPSAFDRSDEYIGVSADTIPAGMSGPIEVTLSDGDYLRFESVAPEPLGAGALAFTALNTDGDGDFAVVVLADLYDETVFFDDGEFTSFGPEGAHSLIQWDTGAVSAGTVVVFSDVRSVVPTVSHGTLVVPTDVELSSGGTSLLAYQGAVLAPTGLAGIQTVAGRLDEGLTGLVEDETLQTIPAGSAQALYYTGLRVGQTAFADYLPLVNDGEGGGWEGTADGESALPFDDTAFVLGDVCGDGDVTGAEDCEPDDLANGDADCDVDCTTPVCGDGVFNALAGESCDDGGDSPDCDGDCTARSCGDGYVNRFGEDCEPAADLVVGTGDAGFIESSFTARTFTVTESTRVSDVTLGLKTNEVCDLEVRLVGTASDGTPEVTDVIAETPLYYDASGSWATGLDADLEAGQYAVVVEKISGSCRWTASADVYDGGAVWTSADGVTWSEGIPASLVLTVAVDEDAYCTASCRLPICGDGEVNGIEDCEGSRVALETVPDDNATTAISDSAFVHAQVFRLDAATSLSSVSLKVAADATECSVFRAWISAVDGDGAPSGVALAEALSSEARDGVIELPFDGTELDAGDYALILEGPGSFEECGLVHVGDTYGDGDLWVADNVDGTFALFDDNGPVDFGLTLTSVSPIATASCDPDCTLVACGDGVVNAAAGELCEPDGDPGCNDQCEPAVCGDGVVEADEACEPTVDGADVCDPDCTAVVCGDGVVNGDAGESCDSEAVTAFEIDALGGAEADVTADFVDYTTFVAQTFHLDASTTLRAAAFGLSGDYASCNGVVQVVPVGVDGAPGTSDVYLILAGADAVDGVLTVDLDVPLAAGEWAVVAVLGGGGESCSFGASGASSYDDGALYVGTSLPMTEQPGDLAVTLSFSDGGATDCDGDCTAVVCGDGVVNYAAGETCDDGGTEGGDGCSSGCDLEDGYVCLGAPSSCAAACGNYALDAGEACDSGVGGSSTCDSDCTAAACGDETFNLYAGENCDSGTGSVACRSDCQASACGDGVVNSAAGEACDAGPGSLVDTTGGQAGIVAFYTTTSGLSQTFTLADAREITSVAVQLGREAGACDGATISVLGTTDGRPDFDTGALLASWEVSAADQPEDGFLWVRHALDAPLSLVAGTYAVSVSRPESGCVAATYDDVYDGGGLYYGDSSEPEAEVLAVLIETGDGGALATDDCNADCTAVVCGDGVVQGAEACEPSVSGTDACDPDCTWAVCGDGTVNGDAGEACDSGALTSFELATVGDDEVDGTVGFVDYDTLIFQTFHLDAPTTLLTATVTLVGDFSACGGFASVVPVGTDGVPGESGDIAIDALTPFGADADGNVTLDLEAPLPAGDWAVGVLLGHGGETCLLAASSVSSYDGGGLYVGTEHPMAAQAGDLAVTLTFSDASGADCDADCTVAECGDGVVNYVAGEACDDGGTEDGDGCSSVCAVEDGSTCYGEPSSCGGSCGDFVLADGEACDTGGQTANCENDCTLPACGDGLWNVYAGEACDPAGGSASCNDDCTSAVCGDGVVNDSAGETCDAGSELLVDVTGDGSVIDYYNARFSPSETFTLEEETEIGAVALQLGTTAGSCDGTAVRLMATTDEGVPDVSDGGLLSSWTISATDTPADDYQWARFVADEPLTLPAGQYALGLKATADGCWVAMREDVYDGGRFYFLNDQSDVYDDLDMAIRIEPVGGGAAETASCDADCSASACGDGHLNPTAGEACDSGGVQTDSCEADCTIPSCGDSITNRGAGEACDSGGVQTDSCEADCTIPSCGDGVLNAGAGEACDSGGVQTDSCEADCTIPSCGDGVTNSGAGEACDSGGVQTDSCEADCTIPTCGDGVLNAGAGEACDSGGVQTASCEANCTIPSCGDGVVNTGAGEACDASGVQTDDCEVDCTVPTCGDGVTNMGAGEACDSGGLQTDSCEADCTMPTCGDSITNTGAGEACDAGGVQTASCEADCTVPTCGDGVKNASAGEACDSGGVATESCEADCTIPSCGDGVWNADAGEACDSGGVQTDSCEANCTVPSCGDGVVNTGAGEACDASGVQTDDCEADCTIPTCGDGVLNEGAGEACDAGGEQTASCELDCVVPVCGDGVLNVAAGEGCDDGGTEAGDGCDASCQPEHGFACDGSPSACASTCGDGALASDEACDDGGLEAGDGCDGACVVEDGWSCDAADDTSCSADCGDGLVLGTEQCDDGDLDAGDGCDDSCRVEAGALVLSEVHLGLDGVGQWVELHNASAAEVDLVFAEVALQGAVLDGCEVGEAGTLVVPEGYLVIALDDAGAVAADLVCDGVLPGEPLGDGVVLELTAGTTSLDALDPGALGCERDHAVTDGVARSLTREAAGGFCLASPLDTYDDAALHAGSPGAPGDCGEAACDGVDDDCDGSTDEALSDLDDDGVCDALDCDPEEALCAEDCATDVDEDDVPDCADSCLAVPESCTGGVDDDCDGTIDCEDLDCAAAPACDASDTDGDGVGNRLEALCGTSPTDADDRPSEDALSDLDHDGEIGCVDEDDDGDALLDVEEEALGTDPLVADSDDDGVGDGEEVDCGSDPDDAASAPEDLDQNGVCDGSERDSDADGVIDALEVMCGSDPEDGADTPSEADLTDADDDGVIDCIGGHGGGDSGCTSSGGNSSAIALLALLALVLLTRRRWRGRRGA